MNLHMIDVPAQDPKKKRAPKETQEYQGRKIGERERSKFY